MVKLTTQDYYNMNQLCNEWGLDLNQLLQSLQKYAARLWVYINNKTCRFDHNAIKLYEAQANTLKDEDFFRLAKLTNKKLTAEGFSITQLPDKGSILAKRGTEEILIHRSKNKHFVSLPSYKANAIEIDHNGFIELCPEFLTDTKINITNLFNGNETYIVTVRCAKQGFIRFLNPAVFIKLTDLYLSNNEFERLNNILNKRELEMLPHIRTSNLLKRADQIANLFNQICVEHPIRIDVEKITQPAQLINLAWIIAFCRMKYNSYADISYKDFALNAMAESMRKTLIDTLQASGELHKLNAKYYDEVDFATETTVTKILSYKLPPDLISSVLIKDQTFNKYLTRNDEPYKQTAEEEPQKVESALQENKTVIKSKKKSPLMRILLEGFVEHLVKKTDYDTYPKFVDLMTVQYLIKEGTQLSNEEKFNECERIKNVYCIRSRKNEAGESKNIKYLIHYSTVNDSGDLVPRKPYSLSSFQKIFDTVRKRLKANEPKITHGSLTVNNGS